MKDKNLLPIILFVIFLFFPLVALLLGLNSGIVMDENRQLAAKPKIGLYKEFPMLFTNYFNDHFGLRKWLITSDRMMRYKLFNVSPNKAITIGKENWLFYTPDVNYIDSVNAQPFSQGDLSQIKNNLLNIQNNFKEKGIKFYFLAAPNKQSVYPEFLPDYMIKVGSKSRLDQLTEYFAGSNDVAFISPKNELLQMKSKNAVYLKYDTHWNEMGAFVAYQKLFQRISQDNESIQAKKISDFVKSTKEAPNNDLAVQMGVEGNFKEKEPGLANKNEKAKIVFEDCPKIYTGCPLTIRETSDSTLPKLVMFRDSFAASLIPFISEHFKRSYYFWGSIPYSMTIVEKEKPEIVVMEITERELWRLKDKLFEF
jgi:hypothetical protein